MNISVARSVTTTVQITCQILFRLVITVVMLTGATPALAQLPTDLPAENLLPEWQQAIEQLPSESALPAQVMRTTARTRVTEPETVPEVSTSQEDTTSNVVAALDVSGFPEESMLPEMLQSLLANAKSTSVVEPAVDPAEKTRQSRNPTQADPNPQNDQPESKNSKENTPETPTTNSTDVPVVKIEEPKPPLAVPDLLPLQELQDDPLNRPWLKLRQQGATAPLKTLVISEDGTQIYAAGDDKEVHAWIALQLNEGEPALWTYDQSFRWQIQRGPRGGVFTMTTWGDTLAFGGYGASAFAGEISLFNRSRQRHSVTLFDLENQSRASIQALAADESADAIVSLNLEGAVELWRKDADSGQWSNEIIRRGDYQKFGMEQAKQLDPLRRQGSAIAMSGGTIYYPEFAGNLPFAGSQQTYPHWQVSRKSLGKEAVAFAAKHLFGIVAMDVSRDDKRLVSAGLHDKGELIQYDLATNKTVTNYLGWPIRSLDLSRDGRLLLVGTAKYTDPNTGKLVPARLLLFRWEANNTLQPLFDEQVADHVPACRISPDQSFAAYTQGKDVEVIPLEGGYESITRKGFTLTSRLRVPIRVGFVSPDDYRIGLWYQERKAAVPDEVFDPVKLSRDVADAAEEYRMVSLGNSTWVVKRRANNELRRWEWIVTDGADRSHVIPLPSGEQLTARAWLPDRNEPTRPAYVIVATAGNHHLLLYRVPEEGDCELIRQYRGHEAKVDSISVSHDHRYLVSVGEEGIVRFWKLDRPMDGETQISTLEHRWGATFRIENDSLVVHTIVGDGPLAFRGVRAGDHIVSLKRSSSDEQEELTAAEMLQRFETCRWSEMLQIHYSRNGILQPYFYLHPAWQPFCSLVMSEEREWAFWTPYGYYDASFNGHRFFGWQFNRGIDVEPEFFLAAELRERFERPRLMQRLFAAGSLKAAFVAMGKVAPAQLSRDIERTAKLRPSIQFLTPLPNTTVKTNELEAVVEIRVPEGLRLLRPKAFANGVAAVSHEQLSEQATPGGTMISYRFNFLLPHDRQIKLQVVAGTNAETVALEETRVLFDFPDGVRPSRRVFVVASGVNSYRDRRIPGLDFSVNNASSFVAAMRAGSSAIYDSMDAVLLTEESVSPSMWRIASRTQLERMRQDVSPDDVILFFLSGHGVKDQLTEEYYYLSAQADYGDVRGRRYADCISFRDLTTFADFPCRKVAILDTCHSGAFRSLSQQDLKTVIRTLEGDYFLTLTATEGPEEGFESETDQLSRFTARLLEGMSGEADGVKQDRRDGIVTLREAAEYVRLTVPRDARSQDAVQHPTFSPLDLLDVIEIPLSSTGRRGRGG